MDKKILVGVVVAVIIVAVAAVILLNPGNGDKDDEPAKSGYTITFDANGGSGTMAPVTGISGTYTPPECKFTAPEGHSFKGWGLSKAVSFSGSIEVESDTTLYAIWNDDRDMGITVIKKYSDGIKSTDDVAKAIKILFKSGDKTSSLDLETLGWAYYYGEATMTIKAEGSSDWSYKTVDAPSEDFSKGTAFTFTYGGEKYVLTFAVGDATTAGPIDPTPTYSFSSKDSATLYCKLGKAA